jgi:hypothetical protein
MADRSGCTAANLTREDIRAIAVLERALVKAWEAYQAKETPANARANDAATDEHNWFKGDRECCYALYCYRSTADSGRAYCRIHDDGRDIAAEEA